MLYIELPSLMYLTEQKPSFEETKGFAKQLRTKLGNAKIKSITQKDFERILEITVEKEEKLKLIIELLPTFLNLTLLLFANGYRKHSLVRPVS